jgi:hypothetical protein
MYKIRSLGTVSLILFILVVSTTAVMIQEITKISETSTLKNSQNLTTEAENTQDNPDDNSDGTTETNSNQYHEMNTNDTNNTDSDGNQSDSGIKNNTDIPSGNGAGYRVGGGCDCGGDNEGGEDNLPPIPPDDDNDSVENSSSYVLTYWGPWVDDEGITDQEWIDEYLPVFTQLKTIGFTHTGVELWYLNQSAHPLGATRITDLRNRGFDIGLQHIPGYQILMKKENLDPQYHENGQNYKYLDSTGFNASECYCQEDHCHNETNRNAYDPGYNGTVWKDELNLLDQYIATANLTSSDLAMFDMELWGARDVNLYVCFGDDILMRSVGRYSGNHSERWTQYVNNWRQRGIDLRDRVKNWNPDIRTFFYGDNIPELEYTWMPVGAGDVRSTSLYSMPNITHCQQLLDSYNFNGSYMWVSFSTTDLRWNHPPGNHEGYFADGILWDPLLSQKIGYLLRQEGVKGIIVYPGPYESGVPIDYFMAHANALAKGFVNGTDPGELTEISGDGWDNNGDGIWDEN